MPSGHGASQRGAHSAAGRVCAVLQPTARAPARPILMPPRSAAHQYGPLQSVRVGQGWRRPGGPGCTQARFATGNEPRRSSLGSSRHRGWWLPRRSDMQMRRLRRDGGIRTGRQPPGLSWALVPSSVPYAPAARHRPPVACCCCIHPTQTSATGAWVASIAACARHMCMFDRRASTGTPQVHASNATLDAMCQPADLHLCLDGDWRQPQAALFDRGSSAAAARRAPSKSSSSARAPVAAGRKVRRWEVIFGCIMARISKGGQNGFAY